MVINNEKTNLVPTAFLRRGKGGRENTLASAASHHFQTPRKVECNKMSFTMDEEFRTEFKYLSAVKAVFPTIPVIPHTATAPPPLLK